MGSSLLRGLIIGGLKLCSGTAILWVTEMHVILWNFDKFQVNNPGIS